MAPPVSHELLYETARYATSATPGDAQGESVTIEAAARALAKRVTTVEFTE